MAGANLLTGFWFGKAGVGCPNRPSNLNGRLPRKILVGALISVALLALTGCEDKKPSQAKNKPRNSQLKTALASAPVPPIGGPGYQDGNIAQAFQIGNRRGHDPFRKQTRRRLQNADANGGNTNYLLTVPILTLPGRGLSVGLNMYYNSQVWTNQGPNGATYFVFDHDADFPAPGWSIGLGKVVQVGFHEGVLVDPDGTPHRYAPCQVTNLPNEFFQCSTHTTDGSLIDYTTISGPSGIGNATAQYPNGTTVAYWACGQNACYPTQITDANGNTMVIQYVKRWVKNGNVGVTFENGPAIQSVTDTLGRIVNFEYDSNGRLTAITAPGLGGRVRTVARFHYKAITLGYGFSCCVFSPPKNPVTVLDGIYFPGDSTGYWFGDPDSYSTYGMISKVSQRRGMTLTANSLKDQGTLTAGVMTRERGYNYPNANSGTLTEVPKYTQMTETWAGMDVPPAVTTYSIQDGPTAQSVDTVYPDGTHSTQWMNKGGDFDGLMYTQITSDPYFTPLYQVTTEWQMLDYNSPVVASVKFTDKLGQTTTTTYAYDVNGLNFTNQLNDVKQFDYDGITVLRAIHTDYEPDQGYAARHIYNLPASVVVQDGQGQIVSRTDYAHDQQPLANAPGVVGYADPGSKYRGNVTQITRYKSVYPNWAGIMELRRYDITGNPREVSGPCCVDTNFTYTVSTQFAYPEKITRGTIDPNSTARVSQSFTYDFGTGVILTSTDSNGLITRMTYDPALRLLRRTLPQPQPGILASAYIAFAYDDPQMSMTQSAWTVPTPLCVPPQCRPTLQAQTLTQLNGLGLPQRVQNMVDGGLWDAVAQQYDARGRLWKVSRPYQLPQQPILWTIYTYDSLGRITAVQNPNGSQKSVFYSETQRPSSASKAPGQTVRRVDEVGRERWSRTGALGPLAEVVEPAANGSGSVFQPGNVDTSYSYNALGLLTRVLQGPDQQERDFQYDPLGRLTAEYLAEKNRTLDLNGNYVGASGQWSDVFTYDDSSNLISHVDARGVKTAYNYENDPLNRLQSITYQTPSTVDPSSPIVPTFPVYYGYMATGDVTRVTTVSRSGGNAPPWELEQYGYDAQGRLASKTLSFMNQPPLASTYKYDSLNRLSEEVYPVEYGTPAPVQKTVDYTYGIGGFLTELKIDGADYASQFAYNPAGQLTSVAVGAPSGTQQTVESYNYDPATNLLQSQSVRRAGSPLLDLGYQYFPSGQVKQLSEGTETLGYDYDALARLLDVKASGANSWSETYTYDSYGNRISVSASGKGPDGLPIPLDGLAGSPTPANGLSALAYDAKTNHVTTPGFAYDAVGNQIRTQRLDGSWVRYRYDEAGRLAQVKDDSGKSLEQYAYGSDGRRLQTIDSSSETSYYFWDGNNVIAEYSLPANETKFAWSKGHAYLGTRMFATFVPDKSSERVYYQHPDRMGVRLITNNVNTTATEQVTLPFGTLMSGGSADPINPVFTSYNRSFAIGLDYAVNRHYDAQQRFTQVDPIEILGSNLDDPQTLNLLNYSRNDPIGSSDPAGLVAGDVGTWLGVGFAGVFAIAAAALVVVTAPVSLPVLIIGGATVFAGGTAAGLGFFMAGASLNDPAGPQSAGAQTVFIETGQPAICNCPGDATQGGIQSPEVPGSPGGTLPEGPIGDQVGSGIVNPDGSVTYTFLFPDGHTETYTSPPGSDSGVGIYGGIDGGTECTTQDNSDQKTKRHHTKDTVQTCN